MPWKPKKRNCKKSNNEKGSWVVVKIKKDNTEEQVSCHDSEEKAKAAIRAKYAQKESTIKVTKKQLSEIINKIILNFMN